MVDGEEKEVEEKFYLDYYIISLKHVDSISIYVINGNNVMVDNLLTDSGVFSISKIKKSLKENLSPVKLFKIDLTDIDGRISNLGENLKENLNILYEEISDFQYNIETIITGIDKDGKRMNDKGFDLYDQKTKNNINKLRDGLELLVGSFRKI